MKKIKVIENSRFLSNDAMNEVKGGDTWIPPKDPHLCSVSSNIYQHLECNGVYHTCSTDPFVSYSGPAVPNNNITIGKP